MEAHICSTVDN